ncbi:2OG-Fe(II) oxygenase [Fabibacter sp. E12]|nr:2OG-Fe(II) oxygenase [Roseivirga sp. E12]
MIDDAISEQLFTSLRKFFLDKLDQEDFNLAGIGPLTNNQIVPTIRKDHIHWISRGEADCIDQVLSVFDQIISILNRYCFLSIKDSEFHLAHYPSGAYYQRHIDQFKDRGNRLISVILYLNEDWQPGNGGELKIYGEGDPHVISPIGKRLVLFKSDKVAHEVLTTQVSRYSLTGWLLNKPKGVGYLLS